jgi:glutaredoxin 3
MKFTVYTKHGCPYCTKILTILNHLSIEKGFAITEHLLGTQFNKKEFYDKFGEGSTFPQVVLNDDINLGGCSDTIMYLKNQKII